MLEGLRNLMCVRVYIMNSKTEHTNNQRQWGQETNNNVKGVFFMSEIRLTKSKEITHWKRILGICI